MVVETVNKYGEKTSYVYAPEHKESAISFYQNIYRIGDIAGYKVTMDDGQIVAIGAVTS